MIAASLCVAFSIGRSGLRHVRYVILLSNESCASNCGDSLHRRERGSGMALSGEGGWTEAGSEMHLASEVDGFRGDTRIFSAVLGNAAERLSFVLYGWLESTAIDFVGCVIRDVLGRLILLGTQSVDDYNCFLYVIIVVRDTKPACVVIAQPTRRPWLGRDSLLLNSRKSFFNGGLMDVIGSLSVVASDVVSNAAKWVGNRGCPDVCVHNDTYLQSRVRHTQANDYQQYTSMKRIVDGITCMTQEPYVRTPKPEYMHMEPSVIAIAATKCTDNMDSAQSSYYKLSLLLRSERHFHTPQVWQRQHDPTFASDSEIASNSVNVMPTTQVGNGSLIRFWNGTWLGDDPMYNRFNGLFHSKKSKDCLIHDRDNWIWDWHRPINSGRTHVDFLALLAEIGNVDVCTWSLAKDGVSSVDNALLCWRWVMLDVIFAQGGASLFLGKLMFSCGIPVLNSSGEWVDWLITLFHASKELKDRAYVILVVAF
ncbi:hypothetical protein Tco_0714858 [Tanacetum coccineum]